MEQFNLREEFQDEPIWQISHYVTMVDKPIPRSHLEILHELLVERHEHGDPDADEVIHQIEMQMDYVRY